MRNARRRNSLRLSEYDYASHGAYFITAVTRGREHLFGEVVAGEMRLNAFGEIVWEVWRGLPRHYPHVQLGAFVVMPNHIHGIIVLTEFVGVGLRPTPTNQTDPTASTREDGVSAPTTPTAKKPPRRHGIPEIVRALKSFSARRINESRGTPGIPVWQRGYHDRIIRNEQEWARIHDYIIHNPLRWENEQEQP